MNTNIGTSAGLSVYRELINKETAGNANWHHYFGFDAQLKAAKGEQDPRRLITVNGLEAAVSLPMPLSMQLFALQRERLKIARDGKVMEETIQPFKSKIPVSQTSIDLFGEEKAYQQRPSSQRSQRPASAAGWSLKGAPHSRGPANQLNPRRHKAWDIDRMYFNREPVGPAHPRQRPQSAFR